jgi:methyl-accepting chemotaxis protein
LIAAGTALTSLAAFGVLKGSPALARIGVSLALALQTMLLTAALMGHAWQLDSHMMFFASLAVLVLLVICAPSLSRPQQLLCITSR